MKVVAIVQARMGSTRLPGKIMREVNGKPLIGYLLERLGRVKNIEQIVLATSVDPQNDLVEAFVRRQGLEVFRGEEQDVLDRFYQAAKVFNAEVVVRICGDCPLLAPEVVEQTVALFLEKDVDYVSNTLNRTYPDGLDVEVFSFAVLECAWKEARLPSEREHVTPFMTKSPDVSRLNVSQETDHSDERWTVDLPGDLELITFVLNQLYPENPNFSLSDVLRLKDENPQIFKVNSMIKLNEGYQKSLEEDRRSHGKG